MIDGFNYGLLPTEVVLNMDKYDYTFAITMLGLVSALVFWLGWNSHS